MCNLSGWFMIDGMRVLTNSNSFYVEDLKTAIAVKPFGSVTGSHSFTLSSFGDTIFYSALSYLSLLPF